MPKPDQPIFRAGALRHYMRGQEKTAYLRFVPLPMTILLWILLGFLLIAAAMAWNEEIPDYIDAPGLIVNSTSGQQGKSIQAILFLPAARSEALQPGMTARLYIASSSQAIAGKIARIEQKTSSPADVQVRYKLGTCPLLVSSPVNEVIVHLDNSATGYVGSVLKAQVKVGTRRLLTLLPGVGSFFAT